VATIFTAGSADRLLVRVGFPYEDQVWFFRIAAFVAPVLVFVITRRICRDLRDSGARPLRGWTGAIVERTPDGGYAVAGASGASGASGAGDRAGEGSAAPARGAVERPQSES
jgi:hypothetical protein